MNHNFKKFVSAAALLCSALAIADSGCSSCPNTCGQGQNLFQPHAFSASMGREVLVGKHAWTPTANEEGWHGQVGVAGEYQKTFKRKCNEISSCCDNLGSLPFWAADNSNQMTVGDNLGGYDLDAYQIGMGPVTTSGTMSLNPVVYQAGADFFLYVGAHKTERGFFIKAHGPVGVIGINPRFQWSEEVLPVEYPQGGIDVCTNTAGVAAPNADLGAAFMNPKSSGYLERMAFGLINCNRTSCAKFGDPEFTVGYNVFADENKHVGIGVRFAAPTGNKAEGVFMLEPIFGRNGHWAAGVEFIGHWMCLQSDTDDKYLNIMFDSSLMHLFKSKHMRSFDLKQNGPGSKYMLLTKYAGTTPQNKVLNAVNITTIGVSSSFAVEGNFALVLDFHWCNWSLAVGYEGWGRTCEQLCVDCACPGAIDYNDYAVLGRQRVDQTCLALGAVNLSEPAATIGTSQPASLTPTATLLDASIAANRIPSNVYDALDINGQIARSVYTSKPFVQVQYTWRDTDYNPYLGAYGGAEIPNGKIKNSVVKLWHVGVQGGIAF